MIHQASTTRVSSPDVTRDNQNDDYVSRWLYKEEELKRTLPLTFALLNSRGAHGWASLIGNIRIKERTRGIHQHPIGTRGSNAVRWGHRRHANVLRQFRRIIHSSQFIGGRLQEIQVSHTNHCHHRMTSFRLFETDRIRFGKVLEDLDALAADIAYRHCGRDANEKYTIVTAGDGHLPSDSISPLQVSIV